MQNKLKVDIEVAVAQEKQSRLNASRALKKFNQVVKDAAKIAQAYEISVLKRVNILNPSFAKFQNELAHYQLGWTASILDDWSEYGEKGAIVKSEEALEIVSRKPWEGLLQQQSDVRKAAQELKVAVEKANGSIIETKRLQTELQLATTASFGPSFPVHRPEELLAALPNGKHFAKTNADGRCSLTLPSGRWILVATTGRQLPSGDHESYVWIVPLPDDDHLTLSNDNLLHQGQNPLALP